MAAIGNVLYLAIFSTALCLSLQSVGLKYINATVGTILLSLEAVFGVIFSVLLCGEVITLKIAFGFIIVFVAVILSQLDFIRPSQEKTAKNTEN